MVRLPEDNSSEIPDLIPIKRAGRPTKFSLEIVNQAWEYLNICKDRINLVLESENKETGRDRYVERFIVNLPKMEGLALYLGISRSRLYEWAKEHESFQDIIEIINQLQTERLINHSLANNYNPVISKLLLSKQGYRDKEEEDRIQVGASLFAYLTQRGIERRKKDEEERKHQK